MSYNNTVIYTINGFMGDMWAGPQAQTGQYLSNQGLSLAYWQPIGYQNSDFPLSGGVANGLAELQNQFNLHGATTGASNVLVSSWSEGSIIHTLALQHSLRGDKGWPPLSAWKGSTTFGNPYRQAGNWAPKTGPGAVPDPGGAGIGGPRNNLVNTPDWFHNYAHPGDMYTCCPVNQVGDDVRIIFDFVLTQWTGAFDDLWEFGSDLAKELFGGSVAVIQAVVLAIVFYGGGTKEHVDYDPSPSMNYLAGIAKALP